MSRTRLSNVIDNFEVEKFGAFFRAKSNDFAETDERLAVYDDDQFSGFEKIGLIEFRQDLQKLAVFAAKVTGALTERSGKKAQYEKAKKILRDSGDLDAGMFIFYDASGNFRFSLIYGQVDKTKRIWSNFKRFTYFVGKDEPNITFLRQIGDGDFSTLARIKEAFSVEKVTKEFYTAIANWYFWAVQNAAFPKDAEAMENGRNIAIIRLITRLIFIWFMKERRLISRDLFDKQKIPGLLNDLSPQTTTYYKAILQNLFFATLNTKIKDRKFRFKQSFQGKNTHYMDHSIYRHEDHFKNREDMLIIFKDIPFLNGGLFDCLDRREDDNGKNREIRIDGFTDREVGLKVPNFLFFGDEVSADLNIEYGTKNKGYKVQGLLNILSGYNFTIDENEPSDQEVALDPELLGKVFENLLASFNPETASTARKATGSYYTPREIVDYMVVQSLKEYFKTHLSDTVDLEAKLESLFSSAEETNPFSQAETPSVIKLIDKLRIVDPAVGSGAFPMGILNRLVFALAKLDPENQLWRDEQIKRVEDVPDPIIKQKLKAQIRASFTDRNADYGRKLYLIQNCIYGVDIQQIAVEIAKLRFFIALLVDENIDETKENSGIEPLPNLDFKLMQGNSLLEEFEGIKLFDEKLIAFEETGEEPTERLNVEIAHLQREYIKLDAGGKLDPIKKQVLTTELNKRHALAKKLAGPVKTDHNNSLFDVSGESAKKGAALKSLHQVFFEASDKKQKEEVRLKIGALEWELIEATLKEENKLEALEKLKNFKQAGARPFFLWKLHFAEVFQEKGGFDIVIANPPYINANEMKKMFTQTVRDYYRKSYYSARAAYDIYLLFFEQGFNLLNRQGTLHFITPNKYLSAPFAASFRDFAWNQHSLVRLVDVSHIRIFSEAANYPVLSLFAKERTNRPTTSIRIENEKFDLQAASENLTANADLALLPDYIWGFLLSNGLGLTKKIIAQAIPLSQAASVSATSTAAEADTFSDFITEMPNSLSMKLVNTGTIDPYCSLWGKKKLTNKGKHYQAPYLTIDPDVVSAHRAELYRAPKIIFAKIGLRPEAFLDATGEYASINTNCLFNSKLDLYYLLAWANSRLFAFIYRQFFSALRMGGGYFQFQAPQLRVMPVKKPSQAEQNRIVAQVLELTEIEPYGTINVDSAVAEIMHGIDKVFYALYGLKRKEIAFVEGTD